VPGIRRATPEDVPALVGLINRAYRVEEHFIAGDRTDEEEVRGLWRQFLVLEEEDGRAGACVLARVDGERGYLGLLSVDPDLQGGGRGRRLIAAVEQLCREAGCRALDIRVVDLREELPPFYRRLGFVETGAEPFPAGAPLKRPAHFVRMTKSLVP
jgi:N-acetylglutamate synthase-like GNAT family acetyltransferase